MDFQLCFFRYSCTADNSKRIKEEPANVMPYELAEVKMKSRIQNLRSIVNMH